MAECHIPRLPKISIHWLVVRDFSARATPVAASSRR
jgi:hypothetical protein